MIRKLIAIAAAIAINCVVLAWFHAWGAAAVAKVDPPANTQKILTLPTLHVHPSAEQLRELRKERMQTAPEQASAGGGGVACLAMPYYSFAPQCDAAVSG
ncbi:MAG: hypothetical protein EPN36_04890 [Rhodanobacteraceae bacterium]|nr:MAG: hypothetical protein EPN36_04890 [Rhodanobacteraceae bacterium]